MTTVAPNPRERAPLYAVRRITDLRIPMRDGATLAADALIPDAIGNFPALVSLYPYRREDMAGATYEYPNRFFASRGYASIMVDLRGTGGSTGVTREAMGLSDGLDGAQVVEWVARQPWCDGRVGMWGVSYGAIAAYHTAAVRPPHLRAIASLFGCLDVYQDWFYPGGCFNCLSVSAWGSMMAALQMAPPARRDGQGLWYRAWKERLTSSTPFILAWRDHPGRDTYWQEKAISPQDVQVPVFIIGGWRDVFSEAAVKAFQNISAPRKLLIGPWLHELPDLSLIAPTEFLPDLCRWWDHWLRDDETGLMEEPAVTYFVQGADLWKSDESWPPQGTRRLPLHMDQNGALCHQKAPVGSVDYSADPRTGWTAGLWHGATYGRALDQGFDDLHSLVFTTEPLTDALEVSGSPHVILHTAVDGSEDAQVVAKLCHVQPNGASELITSGWLRLRSEPGEASGEDGAQEPKRFVVPLWATSYRVPVGHRIRVCLSCSDFPRIWPALGNPRLRVHLGEPDGSRVELPVSTPSGSAGIRLPAPDANAVRAPLTGESDTEWTVRHDFIREGIEIAARWRTSWRATEGHGCAELDNNCQASVVRARPDSARFQSSVRFALRSGHGHGDVDVEAYVTATQFGLSVGTRVREDGRIIFAERWLR